MHEVKLATETVAHVVGVMGERSIERVLGITVEIGVLSCVERSIFEFCFAVAAEGTPVEGAELTFLERPLTLCCAACEQEFFPECPGDACISCGSMKTQVIAGREFAIKSLEVC